ncbi:MAG: hypothetical protein H6722_13515 [Sandaracinus sp.]|nr:hypothetical protein [Sandaracinus sp.]MCB9623340.1 hypothetical protein [Sandaracinus sp.]
MATRTLARAVALVVALFALQGGTAEAKDNGGRFGIGVESALGFGAPLDENLVYLGLGVPGLSLDYHVSAGLQLQAIVGVSMVTGIDDGPDRRDTGWQLALRAIPTFELSEEVNLGIPLGFGIVGFRSNPDPGSAGTQRFYTFEAGVRPEWFIHERLSLFTSVGLVFAITDDDLGNALGASDRVISFDFFGNAGLLGNAGFHFWF